MSSRRAALSLALLAAGCGDAPAPSSTPTPTSAPTPDDLFEDATARAGLDCVHRVPDGRMDDLVEAVGAGATWFDADGDGKIDLFLAQSPGCRVYRNRGDGTFEDWTSGSRVACDERCFMALAFDFDGDGDLDLYLLVDGKNRLFRNDGHGTFDDVTDRAGVGGAACSVGGAVLDADGDGLPDLYVGDYVAFDPSYKLHYAPDVFAGPLAFPAQPDVLYINRGDGTFRDATEESGVGAVAPARAMGATAFDSDLDGRTDLFVANDASGAFLFHNESVDGRVKFVETALAAGVAYAVDGDAAAAMGASADDVDGDGLPDLHVANSAYGSLFKNLGKGRFQDRVVPSGLAALCGQYVAWGGGFFDFDDDGALDLFVANGDLHRATGRPDLLLAGKGDGTFEDAGDRGGAYFRAELPSRAAVFADYDDDGRVDALVTTIGGRPVLLRNRGVASAHWLALDLRGPRGAPALGAIVSVEAGGRRAVRVAGCRTSYLGQDDPRLHFGLGRATRADRVEIRWPDGSKQVLVDVAADRVHRIAQESSGR